MKKLLYITLPHITIFIVVFFLNSSSAIAQAPEPCHGIITYVPSEYLPRTCPSDPPVSYTRISSNSRGFYPDYTATFSGGDSLGVGVGYVSSERYSESCEGVLSLIWTSIFHTPVIGLLWMQPVF